MNSATGPAVDPIGWATIANVEVTVGLSARSAKPTNGAQIRGCFAMRARVWLQLGRCESPAPPARTSRMGADSMPITM